MVRWAVTLDTMKCVGMSMLGFCVFPAFIREELSTSNVVLAIKSASVRDKMIIHGLHLHAAYAAALVYDTE